MQYCNVSCAFTAPPSAPPVSAPLSALSKIRERSPDLAPLTPSPLWSRCPSCPAPPPVARTPAFSRLAPACPWRSAAPCARLHPLVHTPQEAPSIRSPVLRVLSTS